VLAENVFIRADIALSALETFCLIGYISLPVYLLTLFTYLLELYHAGCLPTTRLAGQQMPNRLPITRNHDIVITNVHTGRTNESGRVAVKQT